MEQETCRRDSDGLDGDGVPATAAIRAIRRALQRGHLVVDPPDDRPFARMRRFRPPGVARL